MPRSRVLAGVFWHVLWRVAALIVPLMAALWLVEHYGLRASWLAQEGEILQRRRSRPRGVIILDSQKFRI